MKSNKYLKILIVVLILFFYGSGLIHQINLPIQDLGRHIKNGEIIWQSKSVPQTNLYSYAMPNQPLPSHHWLSGLIFYFLFNLFGFNGLIIFKAIILLLTFLLIFILSAKKGSFWITALFSVPIIFILNQRTETRPEIFSYLLIAIFLCLIFSYAQKPGLKIFWLIPLQLLWVNLHIYFPIGILILGAYVFERIIIQRKNLENNPIIKKLLMVLLLLILVCLINPGGWQGAVYPVKILKGYGYEIIENKSPFFLEHLTDNPSISFFKIITFVLLISFLFNLKGPSLFWLLGSIAVILGSSQMIRNFPLLGLIALPALSINLKGLTSKLAGLAGKRPCSLAEARSLASRAPRIPALLFALFLLIINLLTLSGHIQINNKQKGLGLIEQSADTGRFFKEQNLAGPIFNNYDIGSYLIFELYPQEKVFVDNRPEAYSHSFFSQIYKPIQEQEEQWQRYSEEYGFNVIFFTHQESTPWGRGFLKKRLNDPNWALIQADSQSVILIKNIPQNQKIIEKFQISPENVEERISSLINSNGLKNKMAGINILRLMNQYDLAYGICLKMLDQYPDNARLYLEMASLKLQSGRPNDLLTSQRYFEKAIALGKDFPSVYNQIGLIHFQLNQFEQAKKAWQKALQINPKDETAKSYLEQYQNLNLP